MSSSVERVMVYIDGFNLYYGMKSKKWQRYFWLDLRRLSEKLLSAIQTLVGVRYFTASVFPEPGDPDKPKRQRTYIEALETLPELQIHSGYFLPKERSCSRCGARWQTYEEKMTDVNIAVKLLSDAQDNTFDTAIIVSRDGDLTGPVQEVLSRYSSKRIVVAFPPGRSSLSLQNAATAAFTIGRKTLKDSQFPDRVTKPDGYVLTRPPSWR